jgi:WD40 repeat protein
MPPNPIEYGAEIHAIYFDPKEDDEKIITGGNLIDVHIWSMKTYEQDAVLKGMHSDSVTAMTMDGYFLFTGSDDHTIVMWNLDNYTHVGQLRGHKNSIQALMMFKNGFLASCSYDHKVFIWDYYKGEIIETFSRK